MQDVEYINHKILDTINGLFIDSPQKYIYYRVFHNNYRFNSGQDLVVDHSKNDGRRLIHLTWLQRIKFTNQNQTLQFLNHSFEPILYQVDDIFWQTTKKFVEDTRNVHKNQNYKINQIIIHSEISRETDQLYQYNCIPVHFFGNGVLAAEHWYRLYNGIKLYTDYKPIEHRFICATRLVDNLRKYRIKFLNLIETDKGIYSLLDKDPYTQRGINEILPSNTVMPSSFDEHTNSSAEIVNRYFDQDKDQYVYTPWATSFLHVVAETMIDRVHLTEKIFKPMVLKQPFVLLCGSGALKYLRSYGFKTFKDFWSEDYDNIVDEDQRLQAVADIVNRVANMDLYECETMREKMKPILEHNYNWFYNGFADRCWQELEDNLKDLILL